MTDSSGETIHTGVSADILTAQVSPVCLHVEFVKLSTKSFLVYNEALLVEQITNHEKPFYFPAVLT